MQSCFLAGHRMSTTASMSSVNTKKMNTSSSTGGSKSLGEMEVTQLQASGLSHCMTELSDRSDIHVVQVCSCCRLLADMCACERQQRILEDMAMPLDAIKYIYASRVALKLDTKIV